MPVAMTLARQPRYLDRIAPKQKQVSFGDDGNAGGVGFTSNGVAGIGSGMNYGPGSGGDHSIGSVQDASFMRSWVDSNIWVFSATAMRIAGVAQQPFDVVKIRRDLPADEETRQQILKLLRHPNPKGREKSWSRLHAPLVRDIVTIDGGVVLKRLLGNGEPFQLKVLDGARLIENPVWDEASPEYRYVYLDKNTTMRGTPFDSEEIMHIQSNAMSWRTGGLSPLHVLYRILKAEYDAFRSMHILQKERSPGGLLVLPNTSPETVDKVRDLFLSELAGRSGIGFMDVPADTNFIELSSPNLAEQGAFAFYDMLVRAICAAFRCSTIALSWLQQSNRATANAEAAQMDDGLVDLLELIQDFFQTDIIEAFPDSANLQFRFLSLDKRDQFDTARASREKLGPNANASAINEVRVQQGDEPYANIPGTEEPIPDWMRPWFEEPLVPAGNGLQLPVSVAAAMYAPQLQPAPMPTGPEAGGGGRNENGTSQVDINRANSLVATASKSVYVNPSDLPPHPQESIDAGVSHLQEAIDAVFSEKLQEVRRGAQVQSRTAAVSSNANAQ